MAMIALSMSSSVVNRPILKRTQERASLGERPIAVRTCDGSSIPEVQAEPVDAATFGCSFPKGQQH